MDITAEIVSTLTKSIYEDVKGFLKDELKDVFNKSIEKYIESELIFHSELKSILFGREGKKFTKYYTKPRVIINSAELSDKLCTSQNIYLKAKHLVLVGEAGIGKSSFIKFLINDCLYSKNFIPVLIELRTLENLTLEQLSSPEIVIRQKMFESTSEISQEIVDKSIKTKKIAIFLDGFDEIKSENASNVSKFITTLLKRYPENFIILTSRPYANAEYIGNFKSCTLQPFNDEEILKFIFNLSDLFQPEFLGNLNNVIKNSKEVAFYKLLSNPLFLTLFITSYTYNANIPKDLSDFYQYVIEALFSLHDTVSKYSYGREVKCKLTREEIEKILKAFSFLSLMDGQINFKRDQAINYFEKIREKNQQISFDADSFINDMLTTYSLWIKEDNNLFKFTHKSFQEFFFCSYVNTLSIEKKKIFYDKFKLKINKKLLASIEIGHLLKLLSEIDQIDFIHNISTEIIPEIIKDLTDYLNSEDGVIEYILHYMGQEAFDANVNKKDGVREVLSIGLEPSSVAKHFNEKFLSFILYKNELTYNPEPIIIKLIFKFFRTNEKNFLNLTQESDRIEFNNFLKGEHSEFNFKEIIIFLNHQMNQNKLIIQDRKNAEDLVDFF